MTHTTVVVVSHLKASDPPNTEKLHIVLEEVVKAIYGEDRTLQFDEGSIGENPYENMVHFLTWMNAGIRHHVEGILDRKFGPHFVVGYNGELKDIHPEFAAKNFTAELDEAERRIDARLQ